MRAMIHGPAINAPMSTKMSDLVNTTKARGKIDVIRAVYTIGWRPKRSPRRGTKSTAPKIPTIVDIAISWVYNFGLQTRSNLVNQL